MRPAVNGTQKFGPFVLNVEGRELFRDGQPVPLAGKPFELLLLFVQNQGRVLTKTKLLDALWPGTAVEESNLTQTVFVLRKALGQKADGEEFIVTAPRIGYKFVIPAAPDSNEIVVEEGTADGRASELEPVSANNTRRIWLVAGGALLMAPFGVWYWSARRRPANSVESIVVLPFMNLSGSADEEYLSDGFTEEVIGVLTGIPNLKVVARTSAFQFKGKGLDVREIGKRLQADAVLEGSVRREGDSLRITANLSTVGDGYQLWSKSWSRTMGGIIASQMEVASEVAATLKPNQSPRTVVRPFSENVAAYQDYLRGCVFRRRGLSKPFLQEAIGCFEAAIQKDPKFAAAYARLAGCYNTLASMSLMPARQAYPKAKAAVDVALRIDPSLAIARGARAFLLFQFNWNWGEAEQEFQRAIQLDPADPALHRSFSTYLTAMSRHSESLGESHKALDLDPFDANGHGHLAWVYNNLPVPDPGKALAACKRALEIDPTSPTARFFSVRAYEIAGDLASAIDLSEQYGRPREFIKELRENFAKSGAKGYWMTWRKLQEEGLRSFPAAVSASRLGDTEAALSLLEKAYEERSVLMPHLLDEPAFQILRNNPRFRSLVKRVALPE